MSNLEAIRTQREASESDFQAALKQTLADAELLAERGQKLEPEALTTVQALHREVCTLYAAELSLITNGKLEPSPFALRATKDTSSFIPHPSSLLHANSPTLPLPTLRRQDAPRLSFLPRLLARFTHRPTNRPLDR